MSALTGQRKTQHYGVDGVEVFPYSIEVPLKAGAKVYCGGMIAVDSSGYGVAPTAATGLIVVGRVVPFDGYPTVYDNTSGANGDIIARVAIGIFEWDIGATGDALTQAQAYQPVYAMDDHTVGKTDGGATPRSVAGIFMGLNEAGTQARVMTLGFEAALLAYAGRVAQGGQVVDTAASGALSTADVTLWSISGTVVLGALADGTRIGQRKRVVVVASGSTPNGSITVTTPRGFATITAVSGLGSFFDFMWTATGWVLVASRGGTIA